MKEHIKHAAKSFATGYKTPFKMVGSFIATHPRIISGGILLALVITVIASIKGMLFFLTIIGSIAAAMILLCYLLFCAISNSWRPWDV